jgi:hypothetical protein
MKRAGYASGRSKVEAEETDGLCRDGTLLADVEPVPWPR